MSEPLFCPGFIGIGAQKCATTWLADLLGEHPAIHVPDAKELDFFSLHYERGHGWYRSCFAPGAKALLGEISPSYLGDPLAPLRIARAAPQTRLILALRDPVERAYSAHLHELRKGHIGGELATFERALELNPMYLEQSRYGQHLHHWRQSFAGEQIHIVLQEEIAADPEREARRLFAFLGVDVEARPLALHERRHENIAYKSTMARTVFRGIGRTGRRLGLGRLVAGLKQTPFIRDIHRSQRQNMRDLVPPMRAETRARLSEELAADMRELQALSGRSDFPWPSWRAIAS